MMRYVRLLFLSFIAVLFILPSFADAQDRERNRNRRDDRAQRNDRNRRDDRARRDDRGRRDDRARRDYGQYRHDNRRYDQGRRHRFPRRYDGYRYFEHRYNGRLIGPHSRLRARHRGDWLFVYWPYYYEPECRTLYRLPTARFLEGDEYVYDEYVMVRLPCYY